MEKTYIIENRKSIPSMNNHHNALTWIIRARGKDETREALKAIHVENGIFYATDGHRLHMYSPDVDELPMEYNLPDGNYEVLTNNKDQIILRAIHDVNYPDIGKVLSYRPKNGITPIILHFGYKTNKETEMYQLTKLAKHLYSNTDNAFRLDYLKDAMFEGVMRVERNAASEKFSPIIFGNEERIAVIMPCKV